MKKRKANASQDDISVSVVIPAYNAEDTIEGAISSVLGQTFVDCIKEVIVVDDGSRDRTANIVKALAETHRVIRLVKQNNAGPSAARNAGMKLASSNWIAFLDSDDRWHINKLERQIAVIKKHKDARLVGTLSSGATKPQGRRLFDGVYFVGLFSYLSKSRTHISSIIVKEECVDEVGFFDENMRYAEDQNYFMRFAYLYGVYLVPDVLVDRQVVAFFGGNGLSGNMKAMHRGCLDNITIARHKGYIGQSQGAMLYAWEYVKYLRRIAFSLGGNGNA